MQQSLRNRLAKSAESARAWPEEPIRIALVITDLNVGGAERALVSLASHLDRRRWQPTVFCLSESGPLVDVLNNSNVACECLNVKRRNPFQVISRLTGELRQFKPQLLQSFMFHANLASRFAALGAGSPWVVGALRVAEHQKRWHLVLDRLTAWMSTGSVCVSQGVLRFGVAAARLNPARLTVIPNGINVTPFAEAAPVDRAAFDIPDGRTWRFT